jgi:hypothetical protein
MTAPDDGPKPIGRVIAVIGSASTPRAVPPTGPAPASPDDIAGWLLLLVKTRMAGKPDTAAELSAEIADIVFTLADLPAACWTEATLKRAKGHFEWWPGPAQLRKFLEPVAGVALAAFAAENRPLVLPARESAVAYNPGPALDAPKRERRIRYREGADWDPDEARDEMERQTRSQREQLRALGFSDAGRERSRTNVGDARHGLDPAPDAAANDAETPVRRAAALKQAQQPRRRSPRTKRPDAARRKAMGGEP